LSGTGFGPGSNINVIQKLKNKKLEVKFRESMLLPALKRQNFDKFFVAEKEG
jgi:hypothetical protein